MVVARGNPDAGPVNCDPSCAPERRPRIRVGRSGSHLERLDERSIAELNKVADVMRAMPGGITPELGLVSRPALVAAANKFGLNARDDVTSYEALQRATASGQPVLVDIRSARFPAGHWIAVTGADASGLQIADSSGYDMKSMSRGDFLASWSGRGIRMAGA